MYSTFYEHSKVKRIYTTIKLTNHHRWLRNKFTGTTYKHDKKDILYFIKYSMPLEKPLYSNEIVK